MLNSTEAVAEFHKGYDGHVFRSKAGKWQLAPSPCSLGNAARYLIHTGDEFQAVVELAPIQKTSYQLKAKADARQGTIDTGESCSGRETQMSRRGRRWLTIVTEPDYMSYLESLKSPPEKPVLEVSGMYREKHTRGYQPDDPF